MCKISVIIPCYNSGEYIEKCLRSFEEQTFQDFEIIAVDDCSQDNTKTVILDYMKQTDLVIRLAENEEITAEGYVAPSDDYSSYAIQYAFIVCSIIPIVVIYPKLQKYFAAGINVGGVKE